MNNSCVKHCVLMIVIDYWAHQVQVPFNKLSLLVTVAHFISLVLPSHSQISIHSLKHRRIIYDNDGIDIDDIDAGRTSSSIAATQELIEASGWYMPWAQHLITYPLLNGDRPVELVRSIMATGI